MSNYLQETPWDKRNFNMNTYELTASTESALEETVDKQGHFTLKVNPLDNPEMLLKYGFYYMDTLIEPVCKKDDLRLFVRDGTSISTEYDPSEIIQIADEAFMHGRFHRDFNIPNDQADKRYVNWVKDLMEAKKVFSLLYEDQIAGFYAFEEDKVLLMGMKEEFRSKGLAKSFVSQGCFEQIKFGHSQLRTSISAANVASLNLFQSLGFKLKNTVDVYHKINRSAKVGI
ncbi:GNAT family N-acetyltransferase [Virgibacillus phasianinus]|uniref:GNAT family N-acetyltransferase n=1 Tax=Virgibacillus phasianinus TaxID=2017483 RepID=A0A220U3B7_9BACI|nr:GNAT family N-acetyltransferase [Virgibacillus phasianinus]ASK62590.1 GNAT family N-acetyltransferase [Virgibacillus phasianinus]